MIRILYLATDFFLKGGIQRYSRAQVQALRKAVGAQNVTVLSVHAPEERAFEEPFVTDYNGGGTSFLQRLKYVQACLHFARNRQYEIVWVNHVSLLPLAVFLAKRYRISNVLLNIYGLEMWSSTLGFLARSSLKYATKIISDCHFTANYTQEKFSIPSERFTVIWDPVDTQRFQPMESANWILPRYGVPYDPDRTYLMTLGRISVGSRHKGYDRMLDIMHQIGRQDVIYLIVGDGDDRPRLEQRVADEGLEGRVFFLGAIPEEDLVAVYNAADIFVLVSDRGPGRGEGVPLTPLEAAACGKPIIVGNEDGSQEAVIDGVNGYVVSPRDLGMIRTKIVALVKNKGKREQMGKMACQHIIDEFSYNIFFQKTKAILQNLN